MGESLSLRQTGLHSEFQTSHSYNVTFLKQNREQATREVKIGTLGTEDGV